MKGVRDHPPTPILMVSDGRGRARDIHTPSNHKRYVHLHCDVMGWLRGLWRTATDEQRETLIDIGLMAGEAPEEWIPNESKG